MLAKQLQVGISKLGSFCPPGRNRGLFTMEHEGRRQGREQHEGHERQRARAGRFSTWSLATAVLRVLRHLGRSLDGPMNSPRFYAVAWTSDQMHGGPRCDYAHRQRDGGRRFWGELNFSTRRLTLVLGKHGAQS